ncbi:MAG TPA: lysozyme inhibitor LprI family protein [Paraburkholderia sp.]
MMRATSLFAALFLTAQAAYPSTSIYGSTFDYKKARPASVYFSGKSPVEIASYCKSESLGTMDLSACAQFGYEGVVKTLNKKVAEIEKATKRYDLEHRANGEPEALPFFEKAQVNWQLYRNNNCYSEVYQVGQASLHFVYFWDCMTRMTKNRFDELTKPHAND